MMLLNRDLLQVSILTDADDKEVIKPNTVDVQDNTFTLPTLSKQLSISPPIWSIDSKAVSCQDHNNEAVPNGASTNTLIKCRGTTTAENQGLDAATVSHGGEAKFTELVEQSIESEVNSMTTSVVDTPMNGLVPTLPAIKLLVLYHMMWCIQTKIVEKPPLWPYAQEYRTCRSPIIYPESKVMKFVPPLTLFGDYKNIQVSVTESFLRYVVRCARYEFELDQIHFFSFDNILKLCEKTKEIAENYIFIGSWPNKPRTLSVEIRTVTVLYHIVWCVQNESLPFVGLPMYYRELISCQSPLIPFNNETIQGTNLKWWGSVKALVYELHMTSSTFIELLKCAKKKIFKPDDMINPDRIFITCRKSQKNYIEKYKKRKEARLNQERMSKPIYICLGVILLLFGTIGNLITCVIGVRKKMRQTSIGIYMSSLAIIDTLWLYMRIIPQILIFLEGNKVFQTTFECKMFPFFLIYVDYLTAWLRLCFTLERMVAATLPYVYRLYFSRRVTFIILLACSVFLAAANSPVIFSRTSGGEFCTYTYPNIKWEYILPWIEIVLSTIFPFTGIIVCNSIMIYSLCKARRQRQQLTDSQIDIDKITVLCITTTLCFILSTAPIRLYLLFRNSYLSDHLPVISDVRFDLHLLLNSLRLLNGILNFPSYCISGSLFRKELINLIKCTGTVPLLFNNQRTEEIGQVPNRDTILTTAHPI